MDRHIKNGIISMSIWIIFLVILFGSYLYLTDNPFSIFIDKETGGFISASFFLVWALIWFAIGRHYSIDYELKKQVFLQKYQEIDPMFVCKAFKKAYFSNIARMLSTVFFGSSEKWSDIICLNKKKTAEEFVFLNNHKQIYKYEQQFSISCVGSLQPPMCQRRIQR